MIFVPRARSALQHSAWFVAEAVERKATGTHEADKIFLPIPSGVNAGVELEICEWRSSSRVGRLGGSLCPTKRDARQGAKEKWPPIRRLAAVNQSGPSGFIDSSAVSERLSRE